MQAVAGGIPVFRPWYTVKQEELKADLLVRFFNEYRRASIHIGDTVVRAGSFSKDPDGKQVVRYYFTSIPDIASVPEIDIVSACSDYFRTLLCLILEAFTEFRYELDDRWYYTAGHFQKMGKTIEDAEQELGFPRGWTDICDPEHEAERWRSFRMTQTVGCQINDLFEHYLGKSLEGPDEDT